MERHRREELLAALAGSQNPDGGWAYKRGSSWTEPTALALAALSTSDPQAERVRQGLTWLRRFQRSDGGWPPHPTVDQSTWVTALAVSVLVGSGDWEGRANSIDWILRQTGEESTFMSRLRGILLGFRPGVGDGTVGWPWFPGTAGWVIPTAHTILALEKVNRRFRQPGIDTRIRMGREFLTARTCQDGGWNHGSSRALGYESSSYPETTGIALAALHGVEAPFISRALGTAERDLRRCRSPQGISWLRLGLLAHGRNTADLPAESLAPQGNMDLAMVLLADAAEEGANVVF